MSYLFLAVPAGCGSTALHNYLAKCAAVAPLIGDAGDQFGVTEGQNIYRVLRKLDPFRDIVTIPMLPSLYQSFFNDPAHFDWNDIKSVWDANWEASPKASAPIRMQKSPADIFRIQMMHPYFPDLKWIMMVRDPYSVAESIMERLVRSSIDVVSNIDNISFHAINLLKVQTSNKAFLGDKCYAMTYEDLMENTTTHIAELQVFVPELTDLTFTGSVVIKGAIYNGLVNNSCDRINRLKAIPGAIDRLNKHFAQHEAVMNSWGYKLI